MLKGFIEVGVNWFYIFYELFIFFLGSNVIELVYVKLLNGFKLNLIFVLFYF